MAPDRSLSRRILTGLAFGAAIGILIGDHARALQPLADGFVKLLQMTVLPYVTVSIVTGLGSLNTEQAKLLGTRVFVVVLLFWTLAMAAVFVFPLMFPPNESASFFSTALLDEREPFNFVDLYIPANPFNSLANNVVPAVVLFSIVLGVALITIPEKRALLAVLQAVRTVVAQATDFIVLLIPYGICAIAAVVAGTISLDELKRLEVYLVTYTAVSLLAALWVLPGLVATLTPVPYGAFLTRSRDVLLLAFMTTSLFAVLPLLTERAKALVREYAGIDGERTPATDVIIPISFNLPHTGKILSISFVIFAAWYADVQLKPSDYPRLAGTGLFAMFGSANAAIPFLLDQLKLPADLFQLFITSGVVNARIGTFVAAVHTLAVAVLGACAAAGVLTIEVKKLMRFALVTAVVGVGVVAGTRVALRSTLSGIYDKDAVLMSMRLQHDDARARVFLDRESVPPLRSRPGTLLDRARDRGTLRVGYIDDSLPYAFFNARKELVGFDVDMALALGTDMGMAVEFVPIGRDIFRHGLDGSVCDLVMSGTAITVDRAFEVQFSTAYLDETIAFVVPDHRAAAFSDWSNIREMKRLRVGVPSAPYYVRRLREELPGADVVEIDGLERMFARRDPPLDAFIMTAERGSAYTLLHPAYSVAIPRPRPFRVPLAYVIADRDAAMTAMVNTWIEQKRKDGTIERLFSYWILGQNSAPRQPRWSVMRNVLGWE